jgi:hypothetical protein
MLSSATELVAFMENINKVTDNPKLDNSDKKAILEEMIRELPAEQLCRFSKETRRIVNRTLDEAINETETKTKSTSAVRSKAPPKSPEEKLLRGTGQNPRGKSTKTKVGKGA